MLHAPLVCTLANFLPCPKRPNRYNNPVVLQSVALRFPGFGGGVAGESRYNPWKGPVAPTFQFLNNGRVFIQSWRWDPPKLSRKILSFSQNDFETFLSGGYPNRSSGIHCWGLDLSTRYPNTNFSWFAGYTQLTLVFLPENRNFQLFSWGACHEKYGLSTSSV